jgi:hypothetical protein
MNIEYYNVINQLPLVNNWCVASKIYKFYVTIDPKLFDNINIINLYIRYGFTEWNQGMYLSVLKHDLKFVEIFITHGANNYYECYKCSNTIEIRSYLKWYF